MWNPFKINFNINEYRRIDEFFVVLGRNIVEKLVEKEYCEEGVTQNCGSKLIDTNFAGQSLGQWLSTFNRKNLYVFNHNQKLIHKATKNYKVIKSKIQNSSANKNFKFCENYLVFHKASVEDMGLIYGESDRKARVKAAIEAYENWPGVPKLRNVFG